MIRIGYDNILGYLDGGFAAYKSNGGAISDTVKLVSLDEFMSSKGIFPMLISSWPRLSGC